MLAKVPGLVKKIYPQRIWSLSVPDKSIFLSFDDGPIPEVTPWVLEQLEKFQAKASFFCIGDNVQKHPNVFKDVVAAGHSIGNHSQNHLNGWRMSSGEYLANVLKAEESICAHLNEERKKLLFRPPYGRMKRKQARLLREKGFKIIMWDVLSVDYDRRLPGEICFKNVIKNTSPGSIIVFHDSLKAEKNLRATLPSVLEYYSNRGYKFKSLEFQICS